ncbi:MAG: DNA-deoxyinosine glycosylase [Methylococcaceae bacterium]
MSGSEGFAPIVSENAKVLILGTMPGVASMRKQQYYGHPKNAFWPIMEALFGANTEYCYQRRKEILMANGVSVWDVLQYCDRLGSLDSNIETASIKVNNFMDFFSQYTSITQVFFNGAMAEKIYKKNIISSLNLRFSYLQYQRLPSTSPAYASLTLEQKIQAWKVIGRLVVK